MTARASSAMLIGGMLRAVLRRHEIGTSAAWVVLVVACADPPPPVTAHAAPPPASSSVPVIEPARPVPPPRLVAPMSGASLFTSRPQLRVELAPETDGAEIEVCTDATCTAPIARVAAKGGVARAEALPAAAFFWRARGMRGDAKGEAFSPTWRFAVRPNAPGVDTSRLASFEPGLEAFRGTKPTTMAGDVDGDGLGDALGMECPLSTAGCSGRLLYYSGSSRAPTPLATLWPVTGGEGVSWIAVGDVNGDGHADAVLSSAAVGWLFLGQTGGLASAPALQKLSPAYSYGGHDQGIDINGDGFMDYVGVRRPQTVAIHYGSTSGLKEVPDVELTAPEKSTCFGDAIDFGDVNGDGFADIVVGDYCGGASRRGVVWVFTGGTSPNATPISIDQPEAEKKSKAMPHFGLGVRVVDGDGDGIDDIYASTSCYLDDREKNRCKDAVTYLYRGARGRIAVDAPVAGVTIPGGR